MADTKTSSDLRNKYSEMSKLCRESSELLRTLEEADEDVAYGRVTSMEDSFSRIKSSLLGKEE